MIAEVNELVIACNFSNAVGGSRRNGISLIKLSSVTGSLSFNKSFENSFSNSLPTLDYFTASWVFFLSLNETDHNRAGDDIPQLIILEFPTATLELAATVVLISHNVPTGSVKLSEADEELTQNIKGARN